MACPHNKNRRGFTLLELLLALGILSLISLVIGSSTRQALRSRTKVQRTVDEMSQVRDALRLMQKDIEMAFHARDVEKELLKEIKKVKDQNTNQQQQQPPTPGDPFQTTPAPVAATQQPENPHRKSPITEFIGKEDQLFFATKNAPQFLQDTAQADFIKVGYQITSCRKPGGEGTSVNCLIRRTSSLVEGDITQTDNGTVLVVGVSELKLRYLGAGKQDFVNAWSTKDPDPSMNGKFPTSVELLLSVERGEGEAKHKISMQIVADLRFPNNPGGP